MWPWAHAGVGYVLYSLSLRALGRSPPSDTEAVVLLAATQLPDLIDKPLAWGLGWFTTGYAVGHSVFVAVPLGLGVLALGWRHGRRRVTTAGVVGHWSHLASDVLSPVRSGDPPLVGRVLWPVADQPPYEVDLGLARGLVYFLELVAAAATAPPLEILAVYVLIPAVAAALWVVDGAPGLGFPRLLLAKIHHHWG